ncbi:DUF4249 domain-containing protein [Brumimicrobium mesophilum]|uniref:DUF4249 domain-containing protein n=1 Tax=Brumimicrobium mesophilum TaxID=392717 RepID=UPI000D13EEC8|nr:DUF4249 domain-containing protein [Brumimicrobium mesophilum]
MLKFAFYTLILSTFLSSCIKEVNLNLDKLPQKVVVNGLICPDSLFKVHVTLTSTMQGEKELIDNATIKVFKDGVYFSTLGFIGDGWYQGYYATPEINYKIEVNVPGFETVWAETSIPKYPDIIDAYYEKANSTPDEIGYFHVKTTIIFQDNPNQHNYYQTERVYTFSDQPKEIDASLLTDSELDYNPPFLFFSDALFNGEIKSLTAMGGGSISQSLGGGTTYYQSDYTREFGPVSKEYYLGIRSWTQHYYNQSNSSGINDPFIVLFKGEPTEMYSNVQGGYGVFAGYNFQNLEIEAHE